MVFFELEPSDIRDLSDGDLRDLVGRLCEAELKQQDLHVGDVYWGGAQEAPDGGLDVRVESIPKMQASFIPRGNTGFQVKKHRMGKEACKKEMLEPSGLIKETIKELGDNEGAYIIVSGQDSCSDKMLKERIEGMNEAVKELKLNKGQLILKFYDINQICNWLRKHPSVSLWVRSRLGKPMAGWKPFGQWAGTPSNMKDEFITDDYLCVSDFTSKSKKKVTIAEGIQLVRDKIKKNGNIVRLTGLSGVGKTRFAQALFEKEIAGIPLSETNAIYADLGDELTPTATELLRYLMLNEYTAYLILDNCNPTLHRNLQKEISSNNSKVSLLTIEYDISGDTPEETEVIHIEPASEETVSTLIQRRAPSLGSVNANRIAQFSGGNARIAIALASRVNAEETLTELSDEELFHRLFHQRNPESESLIESAEVLSLVYSFNYSTKSISNELRVLSNISGIDERILRKHSVVLNKRGLVQKRGDWRAVLPQALSNRLSKRVLEIISITDINSELMIKENIRLLISCAHRISYLHNFEPARELAEEWLNKLPAISEIDEHEHELLSIIKHIAPVIPDIILNKIELTYTDLELSNISNGVHLLVAGILRHIAYDEKYFTRAAYILTLIAKHEIRNSHNLDAMNHLKGMYSLYLSGTNASPNIRQEYLKKIINEKKPEHLQVVKELLVSALNSSSWSSGHFPFFGARSRDHGWQPKCEEDLKIWYEGFLEILNEQLSSACHTKREFSKSIIELKFRELWSFARCHSYLTTIVKEVLDRESWTQIWHSIGAIKKFDLDKLSHESLKILEELKQLTKPSGLYSEVEGYVLSNSWSSYAITGTYEEREAEINNKACELGKLIANDKDMLYRLAPRIWVDNTNALFSFGEGIALGCVNKVQMFNILVELLKKYRSNVTGINLLKGYVRQVYDENKSMARELQKSFLLHPDLNDHYIDLICSTPLETWSVNILIGLANKQEVDVYMFNRIGCGRIHEPIPDDYLIRLLRSLNNMDGGLYSTLSILCMRFHIDNESTYSPSQELLEFSRGTLKEILLCKMEGINDYKAFELGRVAGYCLSNTVPINYVHEIIDLIYEGVNQYHIYSGTIEGIVDVLIKNHLHPLLDKVFDNKDKNGNHNLFQERISNDLSPLNLADTDLLINWCDGNQDRLKRIINSISVFEASNAKKLKSGLEEKVEISQHAINILYAAPNKIEIMEVIFRKVEPKQMFGTRSQIMENRKNALKIFLSCEDELISEFVNSKMRVINDMIDKEKLIEATGYSRREQSFE